MDFYVYDLILQILFRLQKNLHIFPGMADLHDFAIHPDLLFHQDLYGFPAEGFLVLLSLALIQLEEFVAS